MKRAHELAKEMKGDYQARMSLALRQAWREEKGDNEMRVEINRKNESEAYLKVDGKLITKDLSVIMGISFNVSKIVDAPKPWLQVFEVDKETYEEKISKHSEKIKKYKEALKEARETKKRVDYRAYTEQCRNPREQCDIDKIFEYVNEKGEIEKERIHTC